MKKTFFLFAIFALMVVSCSEKTDTLKVKTHPADWNNTQSAEFHGKVVLNIGTESCKTCHGDNFKGGTSGVACSSCHALFPHPDGFLNISSPNFHGEFLKDNGVDWHIEKCQQCHGADYSGGVSKFSCNTCHTGHNGPQACNTCHGSSKNIAPPKDLDGNTTVSAPGVGLHQLHVADNEVTNTYRCSVCHVSISGFSDPNHLDSQTVGEADFDFNTLATDNGRLSPTFDRATTTCSDVYCHGNFSFQAGDSVITGNHQPVNWTDATANPDDCTFCHGLPPKGHINLGFNTPGSCSQCHGLVVNADGKIIDKSRHINGKVDLN